MIHDSVKVKLRKIIGILTISAVIPSVIWAINVNTDQDPYSGFRDIILLIVFFLPISCIVAGLASVIWMKDTIAGKLIYAFASAILVLPTYFFTAWIVKLLINP